MVAVAAIWVALAGHRLSPVVAFAHRIIQGLGVYLLRREARRAADRGAVGAPSAIQ
jgi:hypothetical protein